LSRDALVRALLPLAGAPATRPRFWARFDDVAPLHLRVGFWLATTVLVTVWPRLCGFARPLSALADADADAVIQRAAHAPLVRELVEVAKIVACFAAFDRSDEAAP
jgi:hypothetical protein